MKEFRQFRDSEYWVGEDGSVFSDLSKVYLKPSLTKLNYHRYHLRGSFKSLNIYSHRMVAECFIPNPDNKPFVLHNDNNPINNHYSNLRWGNQSENIKQAYDDGRISAKGQYNGQAKICDKAVLIIREAKELGFKIRHIARYFKMNEHYIGQLSLGNYRTQWNVKKP